MKIENILIDLDGTLTDPKLGITTCIRYAMRKLGRPLADEVDLDWCIGPPLKASLAKLLQLDDDTFNIDQLAEQALVLYRERFGTIGLFENEVYPEVAETLEKLQQQGYRLYVATAKPTIYAEQILVHFDLAKYFKKIYGSELTGERTNKTELIAYLLEREQLDAQASVMIGDREFDICGAHQNDVKSIAVSYGYGIASELQNAQPMTIIDSFGYILTTIDQILNKQ
ncbi:HAD-IA family hydrolase [Acinetobacter sp. A3.8]|uniref:HAD-IA family hydrolase n=1 Tax=Acinetobacter sedimenti TaxID=2919922 RepID=A0A9X1WXQ5_9GAMM|nr:HAD-IA family hydrolase [Acinetobacter sedimenti]MCJ8147064.1 HAD-IA family hydrolase [Acinetobacter sedimenti]